MKITCAISESAVAEQILAGMQDSPEVEALKASVSRLKAQLLEIQLTEEVEAEEETFDLANVNYSSLTRLYDVTEMKRLKRTKRYALALSLCNYCTQNKYTIPALWESLVAKNGEF
jgi:hypothetical protein